MVAGLATITPASGFVTVPAAFVIGLTGGVICYAAVTKLKGMLRYDDSLDVFGVHCVGSATGLLLVGLFASADVNAAIGNTFTVGGKAVSLAGSPAQLGRQFLGLIFTLVFAAAGTFLILKVVNALTGLRVTPEEEDSGLDQTQHGESAYND
jgi:Amt family ammonium transporter